MTGRKPVNLPFLRRYGAILLFIALILPRSGRASDRLPNDPYFDQLWYLKQIGAPAAWVSSIGFEGVIVAVIDSGVDIDHPDLKDNIWRNQREIRGNGLDDDGNGYVDDVNGWDFVDKDNDPRPDIRSGYDLLGANHGTIAAGMIAARGDNATGIVGVTWQTTVMPIRVLDSKGSGDPDNIVRAVEYAVNNGAKIINLSFTGDVYNGLLAIALRRAYDAGVLVVAAAGNAPDGGRAVNLDSKPLYPICLDAGSSVNFIYGVAATDEQDKKADFSNYGSSCTDVSAPGTRLLATQLYRPGIKDFAAPYGGYYRGTSLAAPLVAGVAALIKALDPNLTPSRLMEIISSSAAPIKARDALSYGLLGAGRVDAANAVRTVLQSKQVQPATVSTASLLPEGAGKKILVAAPGPGRAPEIRLFTEYGIFVRGFNAFPESFRGGVSLAAGNFDGTGRRTIVAGALAGGSPQIRIFNMDTRPIGGFFAYDAAFRGGVNVAAGDLDGDGKDEIVTVGGAGASTTVRIFDSKGRKIAEFSPYGNKNRAGATVAVLDANGDGRSEIVITPLRAGKSIATTVWNAFGGQAVKIDRSETAFSSIFVSRKTETAPLAMGSEKDSPPIVSVFNATGGAIQFYAYEPRFSGGVNAGVIE